MADHPAMRRRRYQRVCSARATASRSRSLSSMKLPGATARPGTQRRPRVTTAVMMLRIWRMLSWRMNSSSRSQGRLVSVLGSPGAGG